MRVPLTGERLEARNKKMREYSKCYYLANRANRDKYRKRSKDWYAKNKSKPGYLARQKANRQRAYSERRPEVLAQKKAWYRKNKNHVCYRISAQKRRALKKGSEINLRKIKDWMASVKATGVVKCYYCQSLVFWENIHFDHVIPLSKGGPHSVDNLCVSCATCNLRKNDSFINEWMRIGQQMLAL